MPDLRSPLRRRPLLVLLALVVLLIAGYAGRGLNSNHSSTAEPRAATTTASQSAVSSASRAETTSGLRPLSSLPPQAADTIARIRSHGPYPFRQDGVVFNNAERHLPIKPAGYYHEYTVITPGSADRGARRIIVGGNGEYYFTADHYGSFVKIDISR